MRLFLAALVLSASAWADPSPLEQADALLDKLAAASSAEARFHLADEARALCEKAAAARPKDAAPHLCISRSLTVADLAHPESCRKGACERAVSELQRARELDKNGVEAERISSELGIVFSRLGRFPEALAEYDLALRLVDSERIPSAMEDPSRSRSVLYGNSAETLMAMGRLGEAIERYRQADEAAGSGTIESKLALWGLGVALDRDEQVEKSRQAVSRAMDKDPTMAHLSDEAVFFEPAGDKLYYLALGHEQVGERKEALARWNDYLLSQPRAAWARRARAHIDAIKKAPPEPKLGPPIEVFIGMPTIGRSQRSLAAIAIALHEHEDDLRVCYQRALRLGAARADLLGDVQIIMEILPYGRVLSDLRLESTSVKDPGLIHCVEEVIRNWRFPAVSGMDPDLLSVPIRFGKLQ
jgi:tetratricopeptide (TPR) repeat protein